MSARRRVLLGQKDVLYQLESYTLNNTSINTEVQLFETDQDWTIAVDVTLASDPSTGDGSSWRLVCSWNAADGVWSLNIGKRSSTVMSLSYMDISDSYTPLSNITVGTGRYRLVLTHAKNSNSVSLRIRKNSDSVQSFSRNNAFMQSTSPILIGGGALVQRLPTGNINKAMIYNRFLTASEINKFLGV